MNLLKTKDGIYGVIVIVLLVSVTSISGANHKHGGGNKNGHAKEYQKADDSCANVADNDRFDCIPGFQITPTEDECTKRGCCWSPIPNQNTTDAHRPDFSQSRYPIHSGIPSCYYPPSYPQLYNEPVVSDETYGYSATAKLSGQSPYPKDIVNIRAEAYFETANRLRVKIFDADNQRYEVGVPKLPNPPSTKASNTEYDFSFHTDSFGFSVSRRSNGETLFNTSVGTFVFSNQYIQLSSRLASKYVYGLGDSNDRFARSLDWQIIPLFASLLFPDYGSHPFYLSMEESHKSHGVFLFNSNAMDIFLQPTPAISYRVTGGVLDFYFLLGDKPGDVIAEYTGLFGDMIMPPYWSLGFHLCRYNYNSSELTRQTWSANVNAGYPFDVQWNDIDYMDNFKIFTYDKDRYNSLPQLVSDIHDQGMRYVSITDVGIYVQKPGTYATFDDLSASGAYIRTPNDGFATGVVWPPESVFTDFNHPNATAFWTKQYKAFHDEIPYDGAWIDMNEMTTFSAGTILGGCHNTTLDYPPYVPAVEGGELFSSTICMNSLHYGKELHYNVHNLYGISNAIATHSALIDILDKRPFILSRSTAPGHGHYANHWTGDIYSSWDDMKQSITSIMNFNIFGIPMVGADICGFRNDTTLELCQRWTQLGAFYPFARNHNENTTIPQDPASMGPEMVAVAMSALTLRYNLLPFFYTQFYRANVFGETVVRPLFFEFPDDVNTYTIDDQYLWGSSLMVLPVLEKDTNTICPYFPSGVWYLWPNYDEPIDGEGAACNACIDAPIDIINLAIRGGSAIFTQGVSRTTVLSRENPYGLLVALDKDGVADGDLFLDDGESIDTVKNGNYTYLSVKVTEGRLESNVVHTMTGTSWSNLENITIFGISVEPTTVTVNGVTVTPTYNATTKILETTGLTVDLTKTFVVTWI